MESNDNSVKAIGVMGDVFLGGRLALSRNLEIISEIGYRSASISSWSNRYDTGKKDEDDKPIRASIEVPANYLAIKKVNLSQPFLNFGLIFHF